MSELRQDPATYDWVIMAKERAKRPDEFRSPTHRPSIPAYSEDCPFCPGNEAATPNPAAVYGSTDGWRIRVVPNKFAALNPEGDTTREERGLLRWFNGYGRHEVVIETPLHNQIIPFMDQTQVEDLLKAYRDRYHVLKNDHNIKVIIIFKNYGEEAGTSLVHPHSQIVASPIVPPYIRRKYEVATQHYDNTGRCIHHDLERMELDEGTRIVEETNHFVVLHPYASHYPFETWIMPKIHKSSFGDVDGEEVVDLAQVLRNSLLKLYTGLNDPDYNLIIHTAPVDDEQKSYYLWHIQIIPRLTKAAGFELGSGIYINTALPEETAAFMRELRV